MPEKISTAALRRRNRNRVFRCFYQAEKPQTKQEIARELSLSLPTVTQNLRELSEAGVIAYAGMVESTGGRRARTMALVPGARFAVGVELAPQHIRLAAIDLRATVIAFQKLVCPFGNDEEYRIWLAEAIERFLDTFLLDRTRLLGVGLTLPGVIDEAAGIVEAAPVMRIRGLSLSLLTGRIPYPVFVENDASAGGYAEWWNHGGMASMAYLFLGRGVGGALLIDGRPYVGMHHRSAEFGHMGIVPNGAPCSCGNRGCLEAYCSTARLTEDLGLTLPDFFAGLRAGRYADVWQSYLDHLAIGIHTLRMVLDCDVMLGGLIAPYLEEHLPDLRMRLGARSPFGEKGDYVHLGKCGAKANCIGAALHFVDAFLQNL